MKDAYIEDQIARNNFREVTQEEFLELSKSLRDRSPYIKTGNDRKTVIVIIPDEQHLADMEGQQKLIHDLRKELGADGFVCN